MRPSQIVYVSRDQLALKSPGDVPFHARTRRAGRDFDRTDCGRKIWMGPLDMVGIRFDVARLIGRLCRACATPE